MSTNTHMPPAFILAAGNGTRLGGDVPKPLCELGGSPVLTWNLAMLARANVPSATVNWSAPQDVNSVEMGPGLTVGLDPCVRVVYEQPDALLGTAGAIAKAFKHAPRRLLVVYGDQVTQADLAGMLAQHEASRQLATMLVFDATAGRHTGPVGGWVELERDIVIALHETRGAEPPRPTKWANAGVYIIEPEVIAELPDGPSDWCTDVFPGMIERGEVGSFVHDGWVWNIDTPMAYDKARKLFVEVWRPW